MGKRIELPKLPAGQPQEQLQALYSYLYQMAEALNGNLAEIGGNDLTDSEREIVREIVGTGNAEDGRSEAETLKSLIIKTADFVRSELNEYRLHLLGDYVAEGKFGKYVRRTGLDVDVTPTGIQQNYTFQEIIQGLKTYEVNAKNYIKTGLLRTVGNVPVYGVAIGKDVVTFSEDGTETYNDGNKVAELTADELSFWQNGNKVAGYTGSRISFYSGNTEVMYITNGKIYCTEDLEMGSGKKIILGNWEIGHNGIKNIPDDPDDINFGISKGTLVEGNYSGIAFVQEENQQSEKYSIIREIFATGSPYTILLEKKAVYADNVTHISIESTADAMQIGTEGKELLLINGRFAPHVINNTSVSANTLTYPGTYILLSEIQNLPAPFSQLNKAVFIVTGQRYGLITQIILNASEIFTRNSDGTIWTPWYRYAGTQV